VCVVCVCVSVCVCVYAMLHGVVSLVATVVNAKGTR